MSPYSGKSSLKKFKKSMHFLSEQEPSAVNLLKCLPSWGLDPPKIVKLSALMMTIYK